MEKITKRGIVFFIAVIIIICTTGVVAYFIGRGNQPSDLRAGSELERAAEINRTITDEQRRTAEINQRAIEFAERLGGIAKETDSALTELRELNRRSSDIPAQIRAETALLADYYGNTSNVISDFLDNLGIE